MTTVQQWVHGARPRTLPAAAAPVFIGTGGAFQLGGFDAISAVLALLLALALQVAVNFANDYSDGKRGTDEHREGPLRLTAAGIVSERTMLRATMIAFGFAGVFGTLLVWRSGHWWLLAVGVLAVLAAWYYTGGKRPYGYSGLGEIGVFIFFGLVAVLGTTYTQAHAISWQVVLGSIGVGLLACALLMMNNIRDISTDIVHGKRTLAVRLGDKNARRMYVAWLAIPIVLAAIVAIPGHPWVLLTLLLLLPMVLASISVLLGARGKILIKLLGWTGMIELFYGLLFGIGLAL